MVDIANQLAAWIESGTSFALATVIQTWGSSPRPEGSCMAISASGDVLGSVSGGCVESAVIEAGLQCLRGKSHVCLEFSGLPTEAFWEVGLSCGVTIRVLGQRSFPELPAVVSRLNSGQEFSLLHRWDDGRIDHEILDVNSEERSGPNCYFQRFQRPSQLVIFGAVHIAIPLIAMARTLGLRTIIVDPRGGRIAGTQFDVPPDEILDSWPSQAISQLILGPMDYALTLTHDPKIDDEAIACLLRTSVGYVGALGSRSTHSRRREKLQLLGFSDQELDRIHGPIGLPIGAKSPAEIAISILAQIVQVRNASR